MIELIFAVFGIMGLLLFRLAAPAQAVAITCFAGWLLLPVGNFPQGSANFAFPYWIIGTALPSDMLLTKMWWPPTVALVGALLSDRDSLARWRPQWIDVPMLLWCLWPVGQWAFVVNPAPQPWIASIYLGAAWGIPWLLGRIYFSGSDGTSRLITATVMGLLVVGPVALLEGAVGPDAYGWIYEPHPFRADGAERYIGFRPLAFFENGNQYGIWVAATALAALWLWQSASGLPGRWRAAFAILGLAIAVMSQSLGALIILVGGLVLLWTRGRRLLRWILPFLLLLSIAGGAIYLSGVIPLTSIAKNTQIGRAVVDLIRSTGRGSFTWRIARDQHALAVIAEHPVTGFGQWDWWRKSNDERPWGLALLIVGQFGLVGLMLAFGSLLLPVLRWFYSERLYRTQQGNLPGAPLSIIVLMALADALFNSFFFYPAIMAAGALATPDKRPRAQIS